MARRRRAFERRRHPLPFPHRGCGVEDCGASAASSLDAGGHPDWAASGTLLRRCLCVCSVLSPPGHCVFAAGMAESSMVLRGPCRWVSLSLVAHAPIKKEAPTKASKLSLFIFILHAERVALSYIDARVDLRQPNHIKIQSSREGAAAAPSSRLSELIIRNALISSATSPGILARTRICVTDTFQSSGGSSLGERIL